MAEMKPGEEWQKTAYGIGGAILEHSELHRELKPLATSWRNYARKYGLEMFPPENAELVTLSMEELAGMKVRISRQAEEIDALDNRIKTLLEHR